MRILVALVLVCCRGFAMVDDKPSTPAQRTLPVIEVEGQPLAANIVRLMQALEFLGAPLPPESVKALNQAAEARDARKLQEIVDPHVLAVLTINPESRVKAARGPAAAILQQSGFVPVLLKVINDGKVKKGLGITSPQAGMVYGGDWSQKTKGDKGRFLDVEVFSSPPMTGSLSGLGVEYVVALISSSEAGPREATLVFDVGQGTQDLGFRAEVPVLFEVRPAVPVKLSIADFDGTPTTGRFTFRDKAKRVYPSRAKRLAPDFFFQDQVYRHHEGAVLLPPGKIMMTYGRGPEYREKSEEITIPAAGVANVVVKLERWINPRDYGFYSGDHHIHAAGCAHYTNPTEGVFANDMFLHVKGEGLNVGCNLTWGPCYEFQRQFFEPTVHKLTEPFTVLKYDIEVSGFGSQAMGHVCLLNLRDQTYPGSDGTKTQGWPTWTTPVMRWAKQQGGVTGYAHSASGLTFEPRANARVAAKGIIERLDSNRDDVLTADEAKQGVLPEEFVQVDSDADGKVGETEITRSIERVKNRLPNLAVPPMNGIGAQEICVSTAEGVCDFISAMDTARVPEWNCWYHIMNCGFPLKASGETDFPCISGSRVGQGRVYVHLGKVDRIDFGEWCAGIAKGRSYVSDGYAHALQFTVDGRSPGYEDVKLAEPGNVTVKAKVAFAADMPLGTAVGATAPSGRTRLVEIVMNGEAVATREVPADDREHEVTFELPIKQSSWVALRHFPQMHTNPVSVIVAGRPIRASRQSALWCVGVIEQLWRIREKDVTPAERDEARKTFQKAIERYRAIAAESPKGS